MNICTYCLTAILGIYGVAILEFNVDRSLGWMKPRPGAADIGTGSGDDTAEDAGDVVPIPESLENLPFRTWKV